MLNSKWQKCIGLESWTPPLERIVFQSFIGSRHFFGCPLPSGLVVISSQGFSLHSAAIISFIYFCFIFFSHLSFLLSISLTPLLHPLTHRAPPELGPPPGCPLWSGLLPPGAGAAEPVLPAPHLWALRAAAASTRHLPLRHHLDPGGTWPALGTRPPNRLQHRTPPTSCPPTSQHPPRAPPATQCVAQRVQGTATLFLRRDLGLAPSLSC